MLRRSTLYLKRSISISAVAAVHKAAGRVQQTELFGNLPIQTALSLSVLLPHASPDAGRASASGFLARPSCDAVMQALQQLSGGSACSIPVTAAVFLVMCVALEEGSRSSNDAFKRNPEGEDLNEDEAEQDMLTDEGEAGDGASINERDDVPGCGESHTFKNMTSLQIADQLLVLLDEKAATR